MGVSVTLVYIFNSTFGCHWTLVYTRIINFKKNLILLQSILFISYFQTFILLNSILLLSILVKMSSGSSPSTSNPSVPIPTVINKNHAISFRELKKELKDIEKLSKEHLDIRSWASDLKFWIRYQHVDDPETIFTACILTSTGEPREVIQNMEYGKNFSDDDDDDDDDDDSDDEEDNHYPSLDEIINELETFYGKKEDQNVLLKELRSLKIKKYEKVKDFNIRYRSLYLKLDKKRKRRISVLDYADSLKNNKEAWKKVSLKDDISLKKAFAIAEKVDRLMPTFNQEINENFRTNFNNSYKSSNFNNNQSKGKVFNDSKIKEKDSTVDNLTKRIKGLTVSTCFFCSEEGHFQTECPKLNAIIKKNRQEYFENKRLNH